MSEIRMFNHGVFQVELQAEIERLQIQRKSERDPYKQWNLDDQRKILEKMLVVYKHTVDSQLNR